MTARINPKSEFATEQGRQDRWNALATIRMDLGGIAATLRDTRVLSRNSVFLPGQPAPNVDGSFEVSMTENLEVELKACQDKLDLFIRDEVEGDPIVYLIWRVEFLGDQAWDNHTQVKEYLNKKAARVA